MLPGEDASRVTSVSPSSYTDVAGQTVVFTVAVSGCDFNTCARGTSDTFG